MLQVKQQQQQRIIDKSSFVRKFILASLFFLVCTMFLLTGLFMSGIRSSGRSLYYKKTLNDKMDLFTTTVVEDKERKKSSKGSSSLPMLLTKNLSQQTSQLTTRSRPKRYSSSVIQRDLHTGADATFFEKHYDGQQQRHRHGGHEHEHEHGLGHGGQSLTEHKKSFLQKKSKGKSSELLSQQSMAAIMTKKQQNSKRHRRRRPRHRDIDIHPECGGTSASFVSNYGAILDQPRIKRDSHHITEQRHAAHRAYGCGSSKYYCTGEPKPVPCCLKLIYDMWYALEPYLSANNVSYSFRWGSLLFAVRNGALMPWDGRDIDIGYLHPSSSAARAIDNFLADYRGVGRFLEHHLVDAAGVFYERHHRKYGWPNPEERYCFVDNEFTWEANLFYSKDCLSLVGSAAFLDYGLSDDSNYIGMDLTHIDEYYADPERFMIAVSADGPNGLRPPRQMYVFPDYYKHLDHYYPDWHALYPPFISQEQLDFHGLNLTADYWKEMVEITSEKLGRRDWFGDWYG